MKIAHLSSAHPRFDTRIFVKECQSLQHRGHEVHLVIADDLGDETKDKIHIHDVGKSQGRIRRILETPQRVLQKALSLQADVYHLHDPELLFIGLKLKKMGKKVIFDAHEDLPKQLLSKPYFNAPIRKVMSRAAARLERKICSKLDAIVAATPYIRDKFLKINPNTVDVNNYPKLSEFKDLQGVKKTFSNQICYIGYITKIRGIKEIVQALSYTQEPCQLVIAGEFESKALQDEITSLPEWSKVQFLGWQDRKGVVGVLQNSQIGLVTLHPTINYLDALPVKMFEYMAAGVTVIASDFPYWQSILDGANAGLCANPMQPQDIARAIDELLSQPKHCLDLGKNGQKAVKQSFNWQQEEQKLWRLYAALETKA